MKKKSSVILRCAVGYAFLAAVGAADAVASSFIDVSEDSSAPAVHFGGVTAYPGLSITEKRDSNIFRALAPTSSWVTVISPSVVFQTRKAADAYSFTYLADVGRYSQSSPDNYADQNFLGAAELAFSTRTVLRLSPEYKIGHDDRGSTFGPGTSVPSTWHNTGLAGTFMYGAEESRGRVVLDAGYQERQYQNNRVVTTAYDKTLRDMAGALYFRVSPKISAFGQVTDTRIAYQAAASTLSGNERRYLLGATWDATVQTSGTFKIGRLQKKFDTGLPTFSGTSWEGNLRWSPREFARVDMMTSRKPSESTGVGNLVLVTNSLLDFSYDLNSLASLHFNAGKTTEDFSGAGRTDNTKTYGLKAEYKLRNWLVGGVEYTDAAKTSTTPTADYKRNVIAVSIRSQL